MHGRGSPIAATFYTDMKTALVIEFLHNQSAYMAKKDQIITKLESQGVPESTTEKAVKRLAQGGRIKQARGKRGYWQLVTE